MAVWYKALFCGRLIAAIAISNPAEGTVVRLLCLLSDVEVSASVTDPSLVQRSATVCVCVSLQTLKRAT